MHGDRLASGDGHQSQVRRKILEHGFGDDGVMHDGETRAGIGQVMGVVFGAGHGIRRHGDRADLRGTEKCGNEFERVWQDDQDAVARPASP